MPRAKQGYPRNLERKRQLRSEATRSEQILWSKLRTKQIQNLRFRRQHGIGPYIVDFYCPEKFVVIEVDGDIHAMEDHKEMDQQRENYLKSLGLEVIRYVNDDILNRLDVVLDDLCRRLLEESTSPSPLLTKEGVTKMSSL